MIKKREGGTDREREREGETLKPKSNNWGSYLKIFEEIWLGS